MAGGPLTRIGTLAVAALVGTVACGSTNSPGTAAATVSPSASPTSVPSPIACSSPVVTPASSEPQLVRPGIAYDTSSHQVILFGDPGGGPAAQTWAWTSVAGWKQLSPAHTPPGRTWANLAYDDKAGVIILFGGQSATPVNGGLNPLDDTWAWNGSDWSQLTPAASPPATVNMSLAYEASGGTVIGVRDNDANTGSETWQWDGTTWVQVQPSQAPQYPKQGAGLAYAPSISGSVLFGTEFALGAPAPDGTTWTHVAGNWMQYQAAPGDPQPRSFPGMATNQQGGVLMFGGGGSGYAAFDDTWAWSGTWTKQSPALSPSARDMPLMTYDSGCKLVLLYGGELSTGSNVTRFYDTWAWDGHAWVEVG